MGRTILLMFLVDALGWLVLTVGATVTAVAITHWRLATSTRRSRRPGSR